MKCWRNRSEYAAKLSIIGQMLSKNIHYRWQCMLCKWPHQKRNRPTANTWEADISLGTLNSTVHKQLNYRKVCACCMPNNLTHDHKAKCGTPHMSDTLCWSSRAASAVHRYRGWNVGLSHNIQSQNRIHDMGTPISPPSKKCETKHLPHQRNVKQNN